MRFVRRTPLRVKLVASVFLLTLVALTVITHDIVPVAALVVVLLAVARLLVCGGEGDTSSKWTIGQ